MLKAILILFILAAYTNADDELDYLRENAFTIKDDSTTKKTKLKRPVRSNKKVNLKLKRSPKLDDVKQDEITDLESKYFK